MKKLPQAPKTYNEFIKKFPKLGKAWEIVSEAGQEGPLDQKTVRLIKLAIAIGAMRQGAVHSGVRKALALGISEKELWQIVALAAGTLGFPATVAVYSWIMDCLVIKQGS